MKNRIMQPPIAQLKKTENISIIMFFILLFMFPKGYAIGALIILLISGYNVYKKQITWNQNLSLVMLSFGIIQLPLMVNLLQGTTKISEFDVYSRLLFFGVIGACWLKNKPNKTVVVISCGIAVIIGFISLCYAHITGLERTNVNGLNVIQMTTIMSALFAFILPNIMIKNTNLRYFIYITLAAISSGMILSLTKGAVISLIAVVSVCSLFFLRKSGKAIIAVWTVMLVSMLITSLLTGGLFLQRVEISYTTIGQYVKSETYSDDELTPPEKVFSSSGIRLEFWKAALLLTKEKPLFGYGLYEASARAIELANEGELADIVKILPEKNYHFHSIYLDALGKHGLFGLLSILTLFFIPLFIFFKNRVESKHSAQSGILVILSFMISGLVDMSLIGKAPIVVFGILVMLCVIYLNEKQINKLAQH